MQGSNSSPKPLRVFISYRQGTHEGDQMARELYQELHGQRLAGPQGMDMELDFYWDQRAPAVHDFKQHLLPRLKASHVMILVCTAGATERRDDQDFLYDEIDWWLKNRRTGPLLISTDPSDLSLIPAAVYAKYPRAQRIRWQEGLWDVASERIKQGIALSEQGYQYEELQRIQLRNRLLASAVVLMIGLVIWLVWALDRTRKAQDLAQEQLYFATIQSTRDAIEEGKVAEGVAMLGSLGPEALAENRESALVMESWSSQLLTPDEALKEIPSPSLFTWRGQNFFKNQHEQIGPLPDGSITWWRQTEDNQYLLLLFENNELELWNTTSIERIAALPISEDFMGAEQGQDPETFLIEVRAQSTYAGGATPSVIIWNPFRDETHTSYELFLDTEAFSGNRYKAPILTFPSTRSEESRWQPVESVFQDQAAIFELLLDPWTLHEPHLHEDFWEKISKAQGKPWFEIEDILAPDASLLMGLANLELDDDCNSQERDDCPTNFPWGVDYTIDVTYASGFKSFGKDTLIVRTWHAEGSKYGANCILKFKRKARANVACVVYHGHWPGLIRSSSDERFQLFSDFAYLDHEAIYLLDVEKMRLVDIDTPPLGSGPTHRGAAFDSAGQSFAIVTSYGEIWNYIIDADAGRANLESSWQIPERLLGSGTMPRVQDLQDMPNKEIVIAKSNSSYFFLGKGKDVLCYDPLTRSSIWDNTLEFSQSMITRLEVIQELGILIAFSDREAQLMTIENGIAVSEVFRLESLHKTHDLAAPELGEFSLENERNVGILGFSYDKEGYIRLRTSIQDFERRVDLSSMDHQASWEDLTLKTGYALQQPLRFTADVKAQLPKRENPGTEEQE